MNHYAGWYDVGGVRRAEIIVPYYATYRHRFVHLKTKVGTDHDFLAFAPKGKIEPEQHEAVLAVLNSSVGQAFTEAAARTTGGGMASLEYDTAMSLPIPDVRKASKANIRRLSKAFTDLESSARGIGGAHSRKTETDLKSQFDALDSAVQTALGLSTRDMGQVRAIWKGLSERRLARVPSPTPEALQGNEKSLSKPIKQRKRRKEVAKRQGPRLDEF